MIALSIKIYLNITFTFVNMYNNTFIYIYISIYYKWVLNIKVRHLKHIGPLGLAFLTSMFKTTLNKNIIPHTWKLANIAPIPKPNKYTDKGTSYRPISLISVIAKTLEKSLLPYITPNIPNTPTGTKHNTLQ